MSLDIRRSEVFSSNQHFFTMKAHAFILNNDTPISITDDGAIAGHDEKQYNYQISKTGPNTYLIYLANRYHTVEVLASDASQLTLSVNGKYVDIQKDDPLNELLKQLGGEQFQEVGAATVSSPMPGKIIKHLKQEGEAVEEGEPLFILEAMKMENVVKSPHAGVVAEFKVAEGETVQKGDLIVSF